MLEDNDRISTWQVALMLFLGANATEVLKLPRTLMQEVGPAGWLSLIVSHFAVFVPILIMIKLGQRFEGQTFMEYNGRIVGKGIGVCLSLLLILLWLVTSARVVRSFADVLKLFVLPNTPIEVIILTMLLVSAYAVNTVSNQLPGYWRSFFH